MSESHHHDDLTSPLCLGDPLARALSVLEPRPSSLARDALMFAAGAAQRDREVVFWRRLVWGQAVALVGMVAVLGLIGTPERVGPSLQRLLPTEDPFPRMSRPTFPTVGTSASGTGAGLPHGTHPTATPPVGPAPGPASHSPGDSPYHPASEPASEPSAIVARYWDLQRAAWAGQLDRIPPGPQPRPRRPERSHDATLGLPKGLLAVPVLPSPGTPATSGPPPTPPGPPPTSPNESVPPR